MWDNCTVQHRAAFDCDWPLPRLIYRTRVRGSVPYRETRISGPDSESVHGLRFPPAREVEFGDWYNLGHSRQIGVQP